MGNDQLQRKSFVDARQKAREERLGSAVSLCFPEKISAIGCWIYKKECSLS
jgi:hypothetical protein